MAAPSSAIRFAAEPLRQIAFGAIGGAYATIGTAFENPIRQLLVQNFTDAACLFSFDGVNDHFVLDGGSTMILDICANKSDQGGIFVLPVGTFIWVQDAGVAPTLGACIVSAFYGQS